MGFFVVLFQGPRYKEKEKEGMKTQKKKRSIRGGSPSALRQREREQAEEGKTELTAKKKSSQHNASQSQLLIRSRQRKGQMCVRHWCFFTVRLLLPMFVSESVRLGGMAERRRGRAAGRV